MNNFSELANGDRKKFLMRWRGRQEGPYPASVIEAKLAANEIGLMHEVLQDGQWITIRDYITKMEAMIRVKHQEQEEEELRARKEEELRARKKEELRARKEEERQGKESEDLRWINYEGGGQQRHEQAESSIKDAWHILPRLLKNPVDSFEKISSDYSDNKLLYTAIALNLIGSIFLIVVAHFKFIKMTSNVDNLLGLLTKALLILVTPFIALALANFLLRKLVGINKASGFGCDMLASASALLPLQIAGLVALLLGVGNFEVIIVAGLYSIILTTLITYGITLRNNEANSNLILLLTPIKILLSLYITKVIYVEYFQKIVLRGVFDDFNFVEFFEKLF